MTLIPHRRPLQQAVMLSRKNRFIVEVLLNGVVLEAHCPVTGSIGGLNLVSLPCLLSGPHSGTERRTSYTLEAIGALPQGAPGFQWIGINQAEFNYYVLASLQAGLLNPMLGGRTPQTIEAEKKLADRRIDFFLDGSIWLEVKAPLTYLDTPGAQQVAVKRKAIPMVGRMEAQLDQLAEELKVGRQAKLLAAFAYGMDDYGVIPRAVNSSVLGGGIPALENASALGLESWRVHYRFEEHGLTLEHLAPL